MGRRTPCHLFQPIEHNIRAKLGTLSDFYYLLFISAHSTTTHRIDIGPAVLGVLVYLSGQDGDLSLWHSGTSFTEDVTLALPLVQAHVKAS